MHPHKAGMRVTGHLVLKIIGSLMMLEALEYRTIMLNHQQFWQGILHDQGKNPASKCINILYQTLVMPRQQTFPRPIGAGRDIDGIIFVINIAQSIPIPVFCNVDAVADLTFAGFDEAQIMGCISRQPTNL